MMRGAWWAWWALLTAAAAAATATAAAAAAAATAAATAAPEARLSATSDVATAPYTCSEALGGHLREAAALLRDEAAAGPLPLARLAASAERLAELLEGPLPDFRFGWLTLSKWAGALGDEPRRARATERALALALAAGDEGTACVATYNRGLHLRATDRAAAAAALERAHALCSRHGGVPALRRVATAAASEAAETHRALGNASAAQAWLTAALHAGSGGDGARGAAPGAAAAGLREGKEDEEGLPRHHLDAHACLQAMGHALARGDVDAARRWASAAAVGALGHEHRSRDTGGGGGGDGGAGGPAAPRAPRPTWQQHVLLAAVENLAVFALYDVRLLGAEVMRQPPPAVAGAKGASVAPPAARPPAGGGVSSPPGTTPTSSSSPGELLPSGELLLSEAQTQALVGEAASRGVSLIKHAAAALRRVAAGAGTASSADAVVAGARYVRIVLLALADARRHADWAAVAPLEDAALAMSQHCARVLAAWPPAAPPGGCAGAPSEAHRSPHRLLDAAVLQACRDAAATWDPYLFVHAGASTVGASVPLMTVLAAAFAQGVEASAQQACAHRMGPSSTPSSSRFSAHSASAVAAVAAALSRRRAAALLTSPLPALRIGMASFDLRANAMGYLVEGWPRDRDPAGISLAVYQYGPVDSGTAAHTAPVVCNTPCEGASPDAPAASDGGEPALDTLCPASCAAESILALTPPRAPATGASPAPATTSAAFIRDADAFFAIPPAVRDATIAAHMAGRLPAHAPATGDAGRLSSPRLHALVDMAGHFHGKRPGVLACRPARRLQVSHMWPGSTGLTASSVDFLLADARVAPPEHYESVERVQPRATSCARTAAQWDVDPLFERAPVPTDDSESATGTPAVGDLCGSGGGASPAAASEQLLPAATERLALLPHSFQLNHFSRGGDAAWVDALRGPTRRPDGRCSSSSARREPCSARCTTMTSRPPTLASFNSVDKLEPVTVTGWANIARGSPSAQLSLLASSLMGVRGGGGHRGTGAVCNASNATTAAPPASPVERLRVELAARGVHPHRVRYAPQLPRPRHLQRVAAVADLVLDPRWYSGHTSTTDALWVGAPVLALPGSSFASRVSASFLAASGARLARVLLAFSAQAQEAAASLLLSPPGQLRPDHPRDGGSSASSDGAGGGGSNNRRLLALRRRVHTAAMVAPHLDARRKAADVQRAYRAMWEAQVVLPAAAVVHRGSALPGITRGREQRLHVVVNPAQREIATASRRVGAAASGHHPVAQPSMAAPPPAVAVPSGDRAHAPSAAVPPLVLRVNHDGLGYADTSHCGLQLWRLELHARAPATATSAGHGDLPPSTPVQRCMSVYLLPLAPSLTPWSEQPALAALQRATRWARSEFLAQAEATTAPPAWIPVPRELQAVFNTGAAFQLSAARISSGCIETELLRCNTTVSAQLTGAAAGASAVIAAAWELRASGVPLARAGEVRGALLLARTTSVDVLWALPARLRGGGAPHLWNASSEGDVLLFDALAAAQPPPGGELPTPQTSSHPTDDLAQLPLRCRLNDSALLPAERHRTAGDAGGGIRAYALEALTLPRVPPLGSLLAAAGVAMSRGPLGTSPTAPNAAASPTAAAAAAVFATLLFSADYVPGVIALAASLHSRAPAADGREQGGPAPDVPAKAALRDRRVRLLVVMVPCAGLPDDSVLAYVGFGMARPVGPDGTHGVPRFLPCSPSVPQRHLDLLAAVANHTTAASSSRSSSSSGGNGGGLGGGGGSGSLAAGVHVVIGADKGASTAAAAAAAAAAPPPPPPLPPSPPLLLPAGSSHPASLAIRLVPSLGLPAGLDVFAPTGGVWDMLHAWGLWREWGGGGCVLHANADNLLLRPDELAALFDASAVCDPPADTVASGSGGGSGGGGREAAGGDDSGGWPPGQSTAASAALQRRTASGDGGGPLTDGAAPGGGGGGWPAGRLMVGLPLLNARQAAALDASNALMLLRPHRATHAALLARARAQPAWKHAEMGFLSAAFWGHRLLLPHTAVCTPNALGSPPYAALSLADCLSVDFVGCGRVKFKPWHAADPADARYGCRDFTVSAGYRAAIAAWRARYDAALARLPPALAAALRSEPAFRGAAE